MLRMGCLLSFSFSLSEVSAVSLCEVVKVKISIHSKEERSALNIHLPALGVKSCSLMFILLVSVQPERTDLTWSFYGGGDDYGL